MRWVKRKRKKKYNYGSERIIRRFLIFPKTVDHETRWLETAYIHQKAFMDGLGGLTWANAVWTDKKQFGILKGQL